MPKHSIGGSTASAASNSSTTTSSSSSSANTTVSASSMSSISTSSLSNAPLQKQVPYQSHGYKQPQQLQPQSQPQPQQPQPQPQPQLGSYRPLQLASQQQIPRVISTGYVSRMAYPQQPANTNPSTTASQQPSRPKSLYSYMGHPASVSSPSLSKAAMSSSSSISNGFSSSSSSSVSVSSNKLMPSSASIYSLSSTTPISSTDFADSNTDLGLPLRHVRTSTPNASNKPDRYHRRKSLIVPSETPTPISSPSSPQPAAVSPPLSPFASPPPEGTSAPIPTFASGGRALPGPVVPRYARNTNFSVSLHRSPKVSYSTNSLSVHKKSTASRSDHQQAQLQPVPLQPQFQPQLVLPSDIRRNSIVSSRSVSSPVTPTYATLSSSDNNKVRGSLHSRSLSSSKAASTTNINASATTNITPLSAPHSILKKSKSLQPENGDFNNSHKTPHHYLSTSALRAPKSASPPPQISNSSSSSTLRTSSAKTGPVIRDIRASTKSAGRIQPSPTEAPPPPPPQSPPLPEPPVVVAQSPSSNKFGSKLRRALFGKKSSSTDLSSSSSSGNLHSAFTRNARGTPISSSASVRSFSLPSNSNLHTPARKAVDSDTRSMFSMRSTSSTTSTLRKISSSTKSLFKRNKGVVSDDLSPSTRTPQPASPSKPAATPQPRLANQFAPQLAPISSRPLSAISLTPVVTATVVEAEHANVNKTATSSLANIQQADNASKEQYQMGEPNHDEGEEEEFEELFDSPVKRAILKVREGGDNPPPPSQPQLQPPPSPHSSSPDRFTFSPDSNTTLTNIIVTPASDDSRVNSGYDSENIPSLTSSTESALESDDVELTAGDTVFPKTLDLLNVANIRSSLERTKSLERRRSKRSVRSSRRDDNGTPAEVTDETGIPNPTEIHVAEPESIVTAPIDAPAPRSILKSSASSIDSNQLSPDLSAGAPIETFAPIEALETPPIQQTTFEPSSLNSLNSFDFGTANSKSKSDDLLEFSSSPLLSLDFDFDRKSGKVTRSETPSVVSSPSPPSSDQLQPQQEPPQLKQQPQQELPPPPPSAIKKLPTPPPQTPQKSHKRPVSMSNPAFEININNAVINNKNIIPSSHHRNSSTPPYVANLPSPGQQSMYHPLYQQRMSYHGRSSSYGSNISASSYHFTQTLDSTASISSDISSQSTNNTVTFSSRIVIYDTYGRSDYDRRPEIATCNRLTPLLAQQIKEELNSFKSEMEIHTDSKIFTHFF